MNSKIIRITDILEQKVRKEQELEFYHKELEKLKQKMFFLQKDIDITNIIIDMISHDNVRDIVEETIDKLPIFGKEDNADS
jgi:hypothetical protein